MPHYQRDCPYLSKYSSSLIIQLSHMTISCSCSGVLDTDTHTDTHAHTQRIMLTLSMTKDNINQLPRDTKQTSGRQHALAENQHSIPLLVEQGL